MDHRSQELGGGLGHTLADTQIQPKHSVPTLPDEEHDYLDELLLRFEESLKDLTDEVECRATLISLAFCHFRIETNLEGISMCCRTKPGRKLAGIPFLPCPEHKKSGID